jgi:hypothetical protein
MSYNRCEYPPVAEAELPDLSFEVTGSNGDVEMRATYCASPQHGDEFESGRDAYWYLGIYSETPEGASQRIAIDSDASPAELRLMASLLAALADQVEAELPTHLERVRKAREALNSLCSEW